MSYPLSELEMISSILWPPRIPEGSKSISQTCNQPTQGTPEDRPLFSPAPKESPPTSPSIRQDWTTVAWQPSPNIPVRTGVSHPSSAALKPHQPQGTRNHSLGPNWPHFLLAGPCLLLCPLGQSVHFGKTPLLTLTSLLMCQPFMNQELQEPGISVTTVPEGWSPSLEAYVSTCRQRMAMSVSIPPVGMAKVCTVCKMSGSHMHVARCMFVYPQCVCANVCVP